MDPEIRKAIAVAVVATAALVGIWALMYEACRAKFPDAPAWACLVKP